MSHTALVVEDEEIVRNYVAIVLKNIGFDVVEADTEEKAWSLYQEYINNDKNIEYIFADINLTDGSGIDLYKRIRKENRNLVIALSSGFKDGAIDVISKDNNAIFLHKPFTWEALSDSTRLRESVRKTIGAA